MHPNKMFHTASTNTLSSGVKYKTPTPDEVWLIEMEANALAHCSHDFLLPFMPHSTPKNEQNHVMHGKGSCTPKRVLISLCGKHFSSSCERKHGILKVWERFYLSAFSRTINRSSHANSSLHLSNSSTSMSPCTLLHLPRNLDLPSSSSPLVDPLFFLSSLFWQFNPIGLFVDYGSSYVFDSTSPPYVPSAQQNLVNLYGIIKCNTKLSMLGVKGTHVVVLHVPVLCISIILTQLQWKNL